MNLILKIFLLLFLISNSIAFGQTPSTDSIFFISPEPKSLKQNNLFEVGICAGPNWYLYEDNRYELRIIPRTSFGLNFEYHFSKHISILTGLYFENKRFDHISAYGTKSVSMDLWQNPVLIRANFFKKKLFFVNAGTFTSTITNYIAKDVFGNTRKYKNGLDLGFLAGAGFRIPYKNHSIIIEAREQISFAYKPKPTTFNVFIGYSYSFGKKKIAAKTVKDSTQKSERKVFVKFFYSPQITYRVKLEEKTSFAYGYTASANYMGYDADAEIPKYGDEYGLLLEFKLSSKFNLNTGLTFDNQGFTTKPTDISYSAPSHWNPGTTYYAKETGKTVDYIIHFISLPLILNYEFKHKTQKYFYLGAGFESKLRYSYKIMGGHIGNDNRGSSIQGNYFYLVNIGVNIPLGKKLALFIEPYYKSQVGNTVFDTANLYLRLWSAGCKAGLKF